MARALNLQPLSIRKKSNHSLSLSSRSWRKDRLLSKSSKRSLIKLRQTNLKKHIRISQTSMMFRLSQSIREKLSKWLPKNIFMIPKSSSNRWCTNLRIPSSTKTNSTILSPRKRRPIITMNRKRSNISKVQIMKRATTKGSMKFLMMAGTTSSTKRTRRLSTPRMKSSITRRRTGTNSMTRAMIILMISILTTSINTKIITIIRIASTITTSRTMDTKINSRSSIIIMNIKTNINITNTIINLRRKITMAHMITSLRVIKINTKARTSKHKIKLVIKIAPRKILYLQILTKQVLNKFRSSGH